MTDIPTAPLNEIHWSEPLEEVVRSQAERCAALAWAHEAAQRWCGMWNTRLMFPSIILATFTGAGAVGADSLLPFENSGTLIGVLSLFVGTLQTVQNYFAFAKRSEGHRISALQYGKLHAQLETQLSLPRMERRRAQDMLEWLQIETERLTEIVPLIPVNIKNEFQKKFGAMVDYSLPANLSGLERVRVTSIETLEKIKEKKPEIRISVLDDPKAIHPHAAKKLANAGRFKRDKAMDVKSAFEPQSNVEI